MKNSKFLKLMILVLIGAFAISCEDSTLDEINTGETVTSIKNSDDTGYPDKENAGTTVVIE